MGTIALALLLVLAGVAWADEQADVKAILDKAIKAAGGDEKVAQLTKEPFTWKRKITGQSPNGEINLTETGFAQGDMVRIEREGTIGDRKVNFVLVDDGEKGFIKEGEETKEMDKDRRGQFQADWCRTRQCCLLDTLRDKALTLTPLEEIKVEGQTATGVKAVHKDHGVTQLYFDKENGQLLRVVYRTVGHDGKEHDYEMLLTQPKEMAGIRVPTRESIKQDGKAYIERELVALKREEKLDRKLFEKP
jgi:hypothetical protein